MKMMMSGMPGRGLALAATLAGLAAGAAPLPALAQGSLPSGSYKNSCIGIAKSGQSLSARCRRADQSYNDTTLDHVDDCTGDVDNRDGQLSCDKRSHGSGAAAAGAVVGALLGLALVAKAASNSNNTDSSQTGVTTQTQGGFHVSTPNCSGGALYVTYRMGGDSNRVWPMILDSGTRIDVLLPQGTTEAAQCGSPPGPSANWSYVKLH